MSIIESWEVEAEKLTQVAIAAFQHRKSDTTNIKEAAADEAMSTLEKDMNARFHEVQTSHEDRIQQHKERHLKDVDPILLDIETWKSGGFKVGDAIPSDKALELIKSLPLKSYKLRDDKQRDLGVNTNTRRTRYHVGVIDPVDGENRTLEGSSIFSYNIGAVSELAKVFDRLSSTIVASSAFFHEQASLQDKVSDIKTEVESKSQESFKSPKQLASEVAALDTQAALTRIALLSHSVVQSARVKSVYSKLVSRLKLEALKSQSLERMSVAEQDSISSREHHTGDSEAYLDQLLLQLEATDKMKTVWNSTKRYEFVLMHLIKLFSYIVDLTN